jgi:prevent-host-death family protein
MRTVGSYEAKTHLPKLLDQVEQGEEITITRHGKPVATLIPIASSSKKEIQQAIHEIEQISQECTLNGLDLDEMRHEGHK